MKSSGLCSTSTPDEPEGKPARDDEGGHKSVALYFQGIYSETELLDLLFKDH